MDDLELRQADPRLRVGWSYSPVERIELYRDLGLSVPSVLTNFSMVTTKFVGTLGMAYGVLDLAWHVTLTYLSVRPAKDLAPLRCQQ